MHKILANFIEYLDLKKKLFFLIVPVIAITACVAQREVELLQDKNKTVKPFYEAAYNEYRLKPNDELYIQINSLDEEAAGIFGAGGQQNLYLGSMNPYGASIISYTIDKSGYLFLPVIGKLSVLDKTVPEVVEMIKDSLREVLNQPIVSVKLINRYVSILGEVARPGHYAYSQDKLSIYNALGLAGDMTDYADRRRVILVRNGEGENLRVNLNLQSANILSSEYYYLRPKDVLYVNPSRKKFWGFRQFPFQVVLSTITTGLLIYNVVK